MFGPYDLIGWSVFFWPPSDDLDALMQLRPRATRYGTRVHTPHLDTSTATSVASTVMIAGVLP